MSNFLCLESLCLLLYVLLWYIIKNGCHFYDKIEHIEAVNLTSQGSRGIPNWKKNMWHSHFCVSSYHHHTTVISGSMEVEPKEGRESKDEEGRDSFVMLLWPQRGSYLIASFPFFIFWSDEAGTWLNLWHDWGLWNCMVLMSLWIMYRDGVCTIIFTSLSEGVQFTNGWSSSLIAVGLSAGFRQKQHCKKSLPSADSVSGIGGVSFKTLNNAAGCITGTISSENQHQMELDAFDRPIVNSKGTKPNGAYPFAVAPRRLSIYHFNYGTAQTPYIYC